LVDHLGNGDSWPLGEDAILAEHAIFKAYTCDAGSFEGAHGASGLQWSAVTGFAVDQHWDAENFRDRICSFGHLGHRHHAAVRQHAAAVHAVAGEVKKPVA